MLLLSLSHNFISKEEFILLHEASFSKNPSFPHGEYSRFDLDTIDEAECFAEFRVRIMDIPQLADATDCLLVLLANDRTEGLCMVLKRFAYPCHLSDMMHIFGCSVPEMSMITTSFEKWIYDHHHDKITQWNDQLLSPDNLQI